MVIKDIRGKCNKCGRRTRHKKDDKWLCQFCDVGLEDKLTPKQEEILKLIADSKLTPEEFRNVLKADKPNPVAPQPYEFPGTKVRFGVFGDSHIGHKCYDPKLMKHAIKTFNNEKVDFVIHTGDIVEGHYENKRQGSVFELTHVGGDAQVQYAINQMKGLKRPLYFITGNHETNTFYKISGFDIGQQIEAGLKNAKYLGQAKGRIKLPHRQSIEIQHPDGGSSYAISYRSQKIAESLDGGTKPAILLLGHYHKAEYLFYRNIHIFQTGTLQSQTSFMRGKHLSAHKGFWIIDAEVSKGGISKIKPTFYPAY